MKKLLLSLLVSFVSISAFAILEGDGYYRIKNVGSERYITVKDNRGSIDIASTSADLGAVELYKHFSNVVADPSSVLYVQETSAGFKFYAQGTDTYEIIGYYLKVSLNKDGNTYKAYQSNDYLKMYLGDVEMSSVVDGVLGTNAKGTYRDWYVEPIKANSDNYFGIQPEVQSDDAYYASFYASFPFKTYSEGMKVYYINKVDQGMAVYKEFSGEVLPSETPMLIKCATNDPSTNKLDIVDKSTTAPKDNLLGGVYFCNRSKAHKNLTAYDANTMRVLGTNAAGELVFKKVSLDYLPANKAYLKVPAGSPDEIKVVSSEEYEANKDVPVKGITLNKNALELTEGETFQLEASVSPDNATDKSITWSSSDNSIASVSNGLITSLKAGTAIITAKAGEFTATCTVTVKAKYIPVTSIALNKSAIELTEGESFQLEASVSPDNATDKSISWSSSDNSIASVSNGLITSLKAGTAIITAKAGEFTATCTVTVKAKYIPVTSITLDKTSATLIEGETLTLVASIAPDNATNKTITWSSSDNAIATVADGLVTTWKAGEVVITAKADDCTATCTLTVNAKEIPDMPDTTEVVVSGITLDKTEAEMTEGETMTLVATVMPENATDKSISWSSSDETIASVVNGAVSALRVGEVIITAKAGEFTASCTIRVKAKVIPVESITLNESELELTEGETFTLVATVSPDNASDKTIVWGSSDERVATVADGVVSTLKAGEVVITAKAGEITATCIVKVKEKPNALDATQMNQMVKAIYNLQGIKVGSSAEDFDHLPEGLYIINGNKLVKKLAR